VGYFTCPYEAGEENPGLTRRELNRFRRNTRLPRPQLVEEVGELLSDGLDARRGENAMLWFDAHLGGRLGRHQ
jgi:hypothetical protein